jgi:hypothetical protein
MTLNGMAWACRNNGRRKGVKEVTRVQTSRGGGGGGDGGGGKEDLD